MSRAIAAAYLAAGALRRRARVQDHHAAHGDEERGRVVPAAFAAALSVTRGEAAAALRDVAIAILFARDDDSHTLDALDRAAEQAVVLRGSAATPSATLDAWADGWEAYATREAAAADGRTAP